MPRHSASTGPARPAGRAIAAATAALLASGCTIPLPGEDPEWARLQAAPPEERLLYAHGQARAAKWGKVAGIPASVTSTAVAVVAAFVAIYAENRADKAESQGRPGSQETADNYRETSRQAGVISVVGAAGMLVSWPFLARSMQVRNAWEDQLSRFWLPGRIQDCRASIERCEEEISDAEACGLDRVAEKLRRRAAAQESGLHRLEQRLRTLGGSAYDDPPEVPDARPAPEAAPDAGGDGPRGIRLYVPCGPAGTVPPAVPGGLSIVRVSGPADPVVARLAGRVPVLNWPVLERPTAEGGVELAVGPEEVERALAAARG
ncbi:MAG: hypothetical protein L0216_07735 [Planctomycetales bacterium]|nr:hypothetical protein [Planctomycetales bacterium]